MQNECGSRNEEQKTNRVKVFPGDLVRAGDCGVNSSDEQPTSSKQSTMMVCTAGRSRHLRLFPLYSLGDQDVVLDFLEEAGWPRS
jgi:hypothetical protein